MQVGRQTVSRISLQLGLQCSQTPSRKPSTGIILTFTITLPIFILYLLVLTRFRTGPSTEASVLPSHQTSLCPSQNSATKRNLQLNQSPTQSSSPSSLCILQELAAKNLPYKATHDTAAPHSDWLQQPILSKEVKKTYSALSTDAFTVGLAELTTLLSLWKDQT